MPGVFAEALSSADETAKPVMEAVLPLFGRLSSGRTAIRSNPDNHADQIAHLNGHHRRRRD